MAAKTSWRWSKVGGTAAQQDVTEIGANGVWELQASDLRSDVPSMCIFKKGSGADPIGATVVLGMKIDGAVATPEAVAGASVTLTSLATTQLTIPVLFYTKGIVCLTVSGYVAPFKAGVSQ